ncbi:MAG: hypothetical protein K6C32_01585 [Bacilli bacterium]|nr:hypothetical protein [Bacilli bacterium]
MKNLELIITHYKLLDTVKWLNDQHLYATQLGIFKIVHGDIDEDTIGMMDSPTFSTLISYGSKKVARFLLALLRYGYLIKIYDKKSDMLYLSITFKGREALEAYHKKHKRPYVKSKKKFNPQIVKIEK